MAELTEQQFEMVRQGLRAGKEAAVIEVLRAIWSGDSEAKPDGRFFKLLTEAVALSARVRFEFEKLRDAFDETTTDAWRRNQWCELNAALGDEARTLQWFDQTTTRPLPRLLALERAVLRRGQRADLLAFADLRQLHATLDTMLNAKAASDVPDALWPKLQRSRRVTVALLAYAVEAGQPVLLADLRLSLQRLDVTEELQTLLAAPFDALVAERLALLTP